MIPAAALAAFLSRMAGVDADVHTYTATLHAHVRLLTFPFLQTDIVGTIYRREPDREHVVITSGLPVVAQQFGNLYPNIVSPARWADVFTVSTTGESGGVMHLRLVPKVNGNVASIDVNVNDATALVTWLRWNYRNGGTAEMTQRYARVGDDELAVAQEGHIQEPGYEAEISATVDHYKLNVPLSDADFSQ